MTYRLGIYQWGVLVGMSMGAAFAWLDTPMWLWVLLIVVQAAGVVRIMWRDA